MEIDTFSLMHPVFCLSFPLYFLSNKKAEVIPSAHYFLHEYVFRPVYCLQFPH